MGWLPGRRLLRHRLGTGTLLARNSVPPDECARGMRRRIPDPHPSGGTRPASNVRPAGIKPIGHAPPYYRCRPGTRTGHWPALGAALAGPPEAGRPAPGAALAGPP